MSTSDLQTFRDALRDMAKADEGPDTHVVRRVLNGIAQAVDQVLVDRQLQAILNPPKDEGVDDGWK